MTYLAPQLNVTNKRKLLKCWELNSITSAVGLRKRTLNSVRCEIEYNPTPYVVTRQILMQVWIENYWNLLSIIYQLPPLNCAGLNNIHWQKWKTNRGHLSLWRYFSFSNVSSQMTNANKSIWSTADVDTNMECRSRIYCSPRNKPPLPL